jgi:hypothetical protein
MGEPPSQLRASFRVRVTKLEDVEFVHSKLRDLLVASVKDDTLDDFVRRLTSGIDATSLADIPGAPESWEPVPEPDLGDVAEQALVYDVPLDLDAHGVERRTPSEEPPPEPESTKEVGLTEDEIIAEMGYVRAEPSPEPPAPPLPEMPPTQRELLEGILHLVSATAENMIYFRDRIDELHDKQGALSAELAALRKAWE